MIKRQKAILRFLDGRMIKGYLSAFSPADDSVLIEDERQTAHSVLTKELKGIFFVKSFVGDKHYKEKKIFRGSPSSGKKVLLKFQDGESMMGYVEGDVPWEKSFFLESKKKMGFFLRPVDTESNNIRIFVVATSISDLSFLG